MRMLPRLTALALLLALIGPSCGTGRTIVVVDVLSFIRQQAEGDTMPYVIPAGTVASLDRAPFGTPLLAGLKDAVVDTVQVTLATEVRNYSGGPGTIGLRVFFGSDSSTVYSSSTTVADSVTVNGAQTDTIGPFTQTIATTGDSVFTLEKVWIGLRASVNASGSAAPMTGRLQISTLQLRIIFQDKFF